MGSIKTAYSSSQNISCSIASLSNGAARESAYIDNTINNYIDAMVTLSGKLSTGNPSGRMVVYVYFYGSEDGSKYTDNATGADAPLVLRTPTNLRGPFVISTPDAGGLTYSVVIGSVSSFFGGNLPKRWGMVIENQTGVALDATEGNHSKSYTGLSLETT